MKLIIFGSRDVHPTPDEIDEALFEMFVKTPHATLQGCCTRDIRQVVSGKARGADEAGEAWAKVNDRPIQYFAANWGRRGDVYNPRAGHERNKLMAEYADLALGFWKNESTGTANMATQMVVLNKPVYVVRV